MDQHPRDRFSVTMWEFSWLVRRAGAESEYADWDRVLDELAERGYDCIRLDAFPHLVAAGPDGDRRERFTVLPQPAHFMWGNHAPVDVEPRAALVEFVRKARERGISVGLSTWFNDDTTHRAASVATVADYARIWDETLAVLGDAGLLDSVAWVDLCNEWPLGQWARGAFPLIFPHIEGNFGAFGRAWSPDEVRGVSSYFDAILPLKARYPALRFTFSFAPIGVDNLFRLDARHFGLVETHIWLNTDVPDFTAQTEAAPVLAGTAGALATHLAHVDRVYWPERERWLAPLAARMDAWAAWARERGLPLVTTEGWASVLYDDMPVPSGRPAWQYVKDVGEAAVGLAIAKGWWGICTSNFAQPHFPGMWADAAWHRRMTDAIRGA